MSSSSMSGEGGRVGRGADLDQLDASRDEGGVTVAK